MRITRACLVALPLLLAACSSCEESPDEPTITPLAEPWQAVIPFQETPAGLPSIRAADCGVCHTEIYAEWQASTHAVALQDLQFQAEWGMNDHLWLCVNCHTPLANQFERVVTGLYDGDFRRPVYEDNPRFDEVLQQESITCATCHVRDGAILGPGLGGSPPHPVVTDPEVLSEQLCLGCHNVSTQLTVTLLCSFTTGDEWRRSPARRAGLTCIDCHMATVDRAVVSGGPVRRSHTHRWPGGGIAKFPDDVEEVQRSYRRGYDVELAARRASATAVAIELSITNARAGHVLPTGDVERFITLSVTLEDAAGSRLWTHEERIGERWEWHPAARQLSDNSLQPEETRAFALEAPIPATAEGPLFVEVVARNNRMTEENAEANGILGRYPLGAETARVRVEVSATAPGSAL